jgi:hypothetical protein
MKQIDIPQRFPIPFANNAAPGLVRPVPQAHQNATLTDAPASLTDGFPVETFTPLDAGGIPPNGADMNGILNQITAWNRWQAAGNPSLFNQAFCTAIGGYPKGALIASTATPGRYWTSTVDDNLTNPDAGGVGWIGVNADTLRGLAWDTGQDVSFGVGHFHTPNAGTTGGVRIFATPVTGYAYEQILDQNGNQRGGWIYPPDGSAHWNGSNAAPIYRFGNIVWDAGNDGSGSGLDADLLDGRHASDFLLASDVANNLNATSGYQQLPGGLRLTWRNVTVANGVTLQGYGGGVIYSSWARAWQEGNEPNFSGGNDVSVWVSAHNTNGASVANVGSSTAIVLFSIGI